MMKASRPSMVISGERHQRSVRKVGTPTSARPGAPTPAGDPARVIATSHTRGTGRSLIVGSPVEAGLDRRGGRLVKTAQPLRVNALPQGFVVGGVGDDLQFSDGRNWLQSCAVTHVDLNTLDVISKPSDGGHVTGLHGYSLHRVRQLFDGVVQRRGVHLIGHERSLQLEPLGAVSRAGGTKIENVTHVTQDPGGSSVTPRAL